MKRPPQLWVLSIGILCLSFLPNTLAVRATSLIFAKTTTTTTGAPTPEETATATSETSVDANQTITKSPLTGNPQIDYILDPNLPFELKNYNLSDYPFYDRVPEEIDFKCDGLHDGFYASVLHKCQVYHHCLYGTRYDFLCANFTAFDQKTFICHFASEVDCANSKNFWHRNDALYEATTTTAAPTTSQIPFTPSPALNPALRRPSPLSPLSPAGAGGRRRRPFRRRRPQYEYYYDDEEYDVDREEYYDDPPIRSSGRRRNKRPRPNRRPEYEYEQYEDERYDRRTSERRDEERDRRPYDRRDDDRRFDDRRLAGSKNKGRREPEEDDRMKTDERRRPLEDEYERRPNNRPRKPARDRYDDDKQDDRRFDRPTKPEESKTTRRPFDRNRKTEEERRYRPKESRPEEDERRIGLKETKLEDDRRYRPSKQEDEIRYRPKEKQDEEDRRYRPKDTKVVADDKDDRRSYDRPRKQEEDNRQYRPKDAKDDIVRPTEESKLLIRPNSGSSVYDRPRAPPIIRRPVPKTEREKYDYKPPTTTAAKTPIAKVEDEEYYDDYEEEPKPLPPKPTRKPVMDSRETEERRTYLRPRRPFPTRRPVEETENERRPATIKRPSDRSKEIDKTQEKSREIIRTRIEPEKTAQKPSVEEEEEYVDEYEEDKSGSSSKKDDSSNEQIRSRQSATKIETSRETTSKEREHRPEPIVKVVKRPFLPSRGGNPYTARGLQPVGNKALDLSSDNSKEDESDVSSFKSQDNVKPNKFFTRPNNHELELSKQSSQEDISKSKSAEKDVAYYDEEEEFKPVTSRPKGDFRQNLNLPRTTQKPKVPDNYRNPLDINENEYDVTLNDALNPTLPNLPIRSSPTGFSNGRDEYQAFQRPRQITVESASVLSPASSDYTYQVKQPQSTQVQSLRYNPYVTVQQLNYRQQPISEQYYATYQ